MPSPAEAFDPGCVDAAVGVSAVVGNDFNCVHTLHGRCQRVALAEFSLVERLANLKANVIGKIEQSPPRVAHPSDRLAFPLFYYMF